MKFLFIILLFPVQLFAQNISGVWKGNLYNDTTKQFMPYELAIDDDNGKLNGYSYTVFLIDSIKMEGVKTVKIKNKDDQFFIEDNKLIFDNYIEPPAKGVRMFSIVTYSKNDTAEILSGSWNTNATNEYSPLTGTILLQKKRPQRQIAIIEKLDEIGLLSKLSFINIDRFNKEKNNEKTLVAANNISPKEQQPVAVKREEKIVAAVDQKPDQEKIVIAEKQEKNNEKTPIAVNDIPAQEKQPEPAKREEKIVAVDHKPDQEKIVVTKKPEKNNEKNSVAVNDNTAKKQQAEPIISRKENQTSPPKKEEKLIAAVDENENKKKALIPKNTEKQQQNKEPEVVKKEEKISENKTENIRKPVIESTDLAKTPEQEKNVEKSLSAVKEKIPSSLEKPAIAVEDVAKIRVNPPAAQIASRKIETIRTVEIMNDSLVLSLFDNGVIDGDTVTVLINGNVVWPMVGLLERSANKTVYLTPEMGDSISVVMYAENLGSIAPNTGLLVVRDGNTNHEIRFSGDLKKNSAIILKRKKLQ